MIYDLFLYEENVISKLKLYLCLELRNTHFVHCRGSSRSFQGLGWLYWNTFFAAEILLKLQEREKKSNVKPFFPIAIGLSGMLDFACHVLLPERKVILKH